MLSSVGTYEAVRPFGSVCTGVTLSSYDGSKASFNDRFDDNAAPVARITIRPTDVGFLSGCDNWTKVG